MTAYRRPLFTDLALGRYIVNATRAQDLAGNTTTLAYVVMPDHVHLVVESDPTIAPSHLAAQFKGFTSRVLRQEFASLRSRLPALWSRSYYVGSVGHVSEVTVRKYIEGQKTR